MMIQLMMMTMIVTMMTKLLIIQVLHELTAAGLYVDCEVDKHDDNHNLIIMMTIIRMMITIIRIMMVMMK